MVLAILEIISKGVLSRRDAFGMDNCQFSIISKGVLSRRDAFGMDNSQKNYLRVTFDLFAHVDLRR